MNNPLTIDIWSDIACPWCWIGKRSLEEALGQFDGDVEIRWHAFELNPNAPRTAPESVDYAERLAEKYGTTKAEGQAFIDRMVAAGETRGLELRFDRIRPSNTFDAHRLLTHAHTQGLQTELKERLFRAYLHEGRSIADRDTLVELAAEVGLDADGAQEVLEGDTFAEVVRAEETTAHRLGITGVPCFVFAMKTGVSGAQPPEALLEMMQEAADSAET